MEVKQIAAIANAAFEQATGQSSVIAEDLSNVVAAGDTLDNVKGVENFARVLPDVIGKFWFDDHVYGGSDLGLMVDGNEYGSIIGRYRARMPEATENETWELQDGEVYEQNEFYKPDVYASFWNKKATFEIPMSIADRQVRSAFHSAGELSSFITMLYNTVTNAMRIRTSELARRVINNQIAETLYQETSGGSISGRSGSRGVNLLYLYNQRYGTSLTAAAAVTTPEFQKFAIYTMSIYEKRLMEPSALFNNAGEIQFAYDVKTILLDEFAKAIGPFSLAPAYNKEYLALPKATTVAYWQGSGTDYGFSSTSDVNVDETAQGHAMEVTGVLGVMFDRYACVISNLNNRVTSHYNAKAEFTNNWYKAEMGYNVDDVCPFVVFYVA